MKTCDTGKGVMAYELFGSSGPALVIDACLCSCSAEWRHIAGKLSAKRRVLVFDRSGYGGSAANGRPRTPANIAEELEALLLSLGIDKDITLLGHSQGGLYAVQYAIMHPEKVHGIVLLDPATPFDDEFKAKLTEQEYKSSGVDKTAGYRLGLWLTSLGLGALLKPLLKKSPPFYCHAFTPEAEKYLLHNLIKKNTYKTALEEYRYTHLGEYTAGVRNAAETGGLGSIPVRLVTHSSGFYVKELQDFAKLDENTAKKVEGIWQEIMKRYLGLSHDSQHISAPNSGHYIHLTDYDVVEKAVFGLL